MKQLPPVIKTLSTEHLKLHLLDLKSEIKKRHSLSSLISREIKKRQRDQLTQNTLIT